MEFTKISLIFLFLFVVVINLCGPESGIKHGKRPQNVHSGVDTCTEAIMSYTIEVFCNSTTLCPGAHCLDACSYVRENICSDKPDSRL